MPTAPLWVLSFADMITNLMAAFVMLQAFASATQTESAFKAGQGSFRRAIKNFGLPSWLINRYNPPPLAGEDAKRHPTEGQEEPNPGRVIDADGDELRRIFDQVSRSTRMESSDPHEETLSRTVTPVAFPVGGGDLTPADKDYLAQTLAGSLKQNVSRKGVRVLVAGLAPDVAAPRAQHILSTCRAMAAMNVLRTALDNEIRTQGWEISAWGVGEGTKWREAFGGRPGKTFILVALTVPRQ
jgi:flagellar motor protein MotB